VFGPNKFIDQLDINNLHSSSQLDCNARQAQAKSVMSQNKVETLPLSPGQKRKPGRPSLYENAREKIAEVSLELFSQRGFEATSIADVAALAKVPKANVIYYYNSKEELWRSVVDSQWNLINQFYKDRLPNNLETSRKTVELLLRAFLEACATFPAYTSIPALEGNRDTWRARWIAENHLRPHIEATKELHARLFEAGIIRTPDALVFQTVFGGCGHLFFGQAQLWKQADGSGKTDEEYSEQFVEGLLSLICV
jgi:TetR/AcrR family transcriptional regulator